MWRVGRTVACALATVAVLAAAAPAAAQTVWAVGDGAVAGETDDQLADYIGGSGALDRFLYLGDVYETGTAQEFADNYDTSFGVFKAKSSPTPGNHEWGNRATGYDPYWGPLAPQTNGGHWYSFDLGDWHFVSINSEESVAADSAQIAWLNQDLAARQGTCTIAVMHKPRFTATEGLGVTERTELATVWNELKGHAVALLSGHDHNYERFHPVDGIAQFIAGTGGRSLHPLNEADARLAAGSDQVFGALRVQLARGSAEFAFFPTGAAQPLDSGTLACTPQPSQDPPSQDPPPSQQPAPNQQPPPPEPPGPDLVPAPPAPPTSRLSVTSPKHGARHSPRLRLLWGEVTGAARPVAVTLVRRGRGTCTRFDGRRFVRASCRTRAGVEAKTASRWALRLPGSARLAPGTYRLTARVVGADGVNRRAGVTFRIR
jgi:hypothetical protein